MFDGRVRNGIGSDHSFMATKKRKSEASNQSSNFNSEPRADSPTKFKRTNRINRDSLKTAHRITGQLLFVSFKSLSFPSKKKKKSNQAARPISTSRLNVLQRLHLWPIKRVVCPWSLGSLRSGKHYLGRSLALRCFQRLSLPHMATQRCP